MRSLLRLFSFAILGTALASTGCSEEPPADLGSAVLSLQIGGGVALDTLGYTLTGPGAFSRAGTINLASSGTISATIGGLPAGNGYVLTVTGTASDGATTCGGSASFNITAKVTTNVMLHLLCREPARTGSANVSGTLNVCPLIDALSASPGQVAVGSTLALSAMAHDSDGAPAALAYQWTASAGGVVGTGANATFTCTGPGSATITLIVTDGDCSDTGVVSVSCSGSPPDAGTPDATLSPDAAPPLPSIKINEVESNGGTPGDWTELYNAGSAAADISGWVFKDNDDTHNYAIPAGTVIPAGGYYLVEEAAQNFGLGAADSARIFTPGAAVLVDSYSWTAHATITYGRCPNGTGGFINTSSSTKGAANDCGAVASPDAGVPADATAAPADASMVTLEAWPGQNNVVTADNLNQFGDNLSGLTYEPAAGGNPAVLWGALNAPGSIYRLLWNGSIFTFDTANDWGAGKGLRYPGGVAGDPDTESVTRAEYDSPFVYTSAERNNAASSVSRLSILRFDASAAGTTLTATHEWNLTADVPATGANLGLEGITWIPDSHLVAKDFLDESRTALYNPANYPNHGTGLFVVGVEGTGTLYAYALDHGTGGFTKIATIPSGLPGLMGLEFDRETGALWAACDNTCAGNQNVLGIAAGKFVVKRSFARPSTLPDSNNEGVAFSPESECVGGFKKFFWSDDSHFGGHALRIDSIPCGPLF
jgi:hypothetical protein